MYRRYFALLLLAAIPVSVFSSLPSHRTAAVIAQDPAPPAPVVAPSPVPAPVAPLAEIIGPTKTAGTFFLTIKTTEGAVNTWRNDYPFVEGQPFKPNVVELKNGAELWIFQDPPAGLYLHKLRSQMPTTATPENPTGRDPIFDLEFATTVGTLAPPKPEPDPTTPDEPPVPEDGDAAKVKVPGFRCLLLCEKKNGIPDIFADAAVRSYLTSHVMKGADGVTPEWRLKDNDEPATGDFAVWKLYRETLPDGSNEGNFVSCGNGTIGYAGPAPATGADLLTLLKKYGGP